MKAELIENWRGGKKATESQNVRSSRNTCLEEPKALATTSLSFNQDSALEMTGNPQRQGHSEDVIIPVFCLLRLY